MQDEATQMGRETNYRFFYGASAAAILSLIVLFVITGYTAHTATEMNAVISDINELLPEAKDSLRIIRESLLVNTFNERLLKIQEEEVIFVRNFAPFIHGENSVSIFEKIEKAIKNIERNANPKILFYELSLQMMRLLKVKRKLAKKN